MITNIKSTRNSLVFGSLFLLLNACTDHFEAINTNKTQIMDVTEKELAGLFTRSQINGIACLTSDQYGRATRYWSNPQSGYFVTDSYDAEQMIVNYDHITTVQNVFFSRAIPAIVTIQEKTKTGDLAAYHVATIWKVYMMYQLADVWGPIPYVEAGSGQESVAYESVEAVYNHAFADLTAAADYLANALQGNPALNVFGSGDIIFEGQASKWLKFANTMRLRLAMRISNVNPERAKAEAEAAAAGITMDVNDDNAWLVKLPTFNGLENGMVRNRNSMLMNASIESFMKGFGDPRLPVYFSPVANQNIAGMPPEIAANVGGYHGLMPGYSPADRVYIRMYSAPGPQWAGAGIISTEVPIPLKFAAETYFLKAEGAWKGWNMGGTAKGFYEMGIATSLRQWLPGIEQTAVNDYLNGETPPANPNSFPYPDGALTDIPVKFSASSEKQYEQIITQKWLALYPDSWEAWTEYRRTRLPRLYQRRGSLNADVNVNVGQIMTRIVYPESEKISQPEEVAKAVALLGGPDAYSTPIWWDVHPNGVN